jgi:DNA-cytosine methyltransferase
MKYLSICSGIEACTVAWHPLGWEAIGFAEIEEFRSEVLKYHYPEVKNYGDFTKITKEKIGCHTDVLVGGTPCATFSIAGLRKGLNEDRGNLALEFIKLIERVRPTWVIWENVFGVLSSNKGEDFATFLGALAELGYGFAYRVLDTQYVRTQRYPRAIPQRRRRVFVVGHIGDWRYPAEVLFNKEEVSKDFRPSRGKKKTLTKEFAEGFNEKHRLEEPYIIRESHTKSNGKPYKNDGSSFTLTASDRYSVTVFETSTPDKTARIQKEDISPTLTAMTGGNRQPCVFVEYKDGQEESSEGLIHIADEVTEVTVRKHEVDINQLQQLLKSSKEKTGLTNKDIGLSLNVPQTKVEHWFRNDSSFAIPSSYIWYELKELLEIDTDFFDKSITEFITREGVFESAKRIYDSKASYPTITASNLLPKIIHKSKKTELRQLTCIEAERLQGFPDDYTKIPYKGKSIENCPTSKRYEAVGRSMSINVMEWLGTRIEEVHNKYER